MQTLLMPLTNWNAYRASAPFSSEEWAATDRGWLYLLNHPNKDEAWDGNLSVGNYLAYPRHPEGPMVHACWTPWKIDPVTKGYVRLTGEAKVCATVTEAQAWLEEKVSAWVANS